MKNKGYKIQSRFNADARFEISIDAKGWNFLLIYGKHVNGYYCCIPNWNIGCEMSDPQDTFYNEEQLRKSAALMEEGTQKVLLGVARQLAIAIKDFARQLERKEAMPIEKSVTEELEEQMTKQSMTAEVVE